MNHVSRRAGNQAHKNNALPAACGYGMVFGLGTSLLLLPIAAGIAYSQADPVRMAVPAALSVLYLSVLCSGIVSSRKAATPLLASGICGGIFLLLTAILALFPISAATCGFNTVTSVIAHLAIPFVALLGALLGKKRTNRSSTHPRKRRR